ncbi:MAG TPA: four helix bundle suffix domain-containing protein [Chlorobaculum sp.]|nr:four helix bundle suffix domain-containing protein [Chlorobaculum sp.]
MSIEPLIPRHGGYRNLKAFQIAQLVYDVTVRFCDRFVDRRSRTHDQMVQAARSGVQNIAEGSQASATSKKTELKLTNVARASLEELRLDYEDFLRQRDLAIWKHDDSRRKSLIARRCSNADEVAKWVKEVHERKLWELHEEDGRNGLNGQHGRNSSKAALPGIAANAALTLVAVANSLLDRQIDTLAKEFESNGGFTEKLYRIRSMRKRNNP